MFLMLPFYVQAQIDICPAPPTTFNTENLMPEGHVKVSAQNARIEQQQSAFFDGGVTIVSDNAIISAEQAVVSDNGKKLEASGDVSYQDPLLNVLSDKINADSEQNNLALEATIYQLAGFSGRGEADQILVSEQQGVSLLDVSFTTCPLLSSDAAPDWALKASEISIAKDSNIGEAKHTRFYVGEVPVFYLPYFAFPTSSERQTGLLFPNITSSSPAGIDISQPVYWNIAPNYDLTVTPRLMTNRGLQLNTEFRYLTEEQQGQLNIEYLGEDTDIAERPSRYFYRFQHQGALSENWYWNADINGLSDNNYIVDLGSDFYNRADAHMLRIIGADYTSENISASVYLRDFELVGDNVSTYRALPEITVDGRYPFNDYIQMSFESEIAYFDNADPLAPKALRAHFAPSLSLPYRRHWGEFNAQATLFKTLYRQNNISQNSPLEENVVRTIEQGRLYGALFFERQGSWLGNGSRTTLEPKFQYLYTSYDDQDNIGFYDSTALITDVDGLFRAREFTGLDRISDNNQITLGLTSRIIDEKDREQFVVSIGQIVYFEDSEIATFRNLDDRSSIAGEIDWRFANRWYFHTDIQLLSESRKVDRSSLILEYRRSADELVQLTHRFVRDISGITVDQLGLSASWPLARNWKWVGRIYQDLERNRSIESYSGIEYESCCWSIRLTAQRQLTNRFNIDGGQSVDEFDTGISLQFSFKGIGTRSNTRSMLEEGMFGYRQPYGLN